MTYPFPTDPKAIWTPRDICALLCSDGYMSPNDWRPITACAVVLGESGGNPLALGKLVYKPESPAHLSIDLGMFQINSYWQVANDPYPTVPRISWADTFDPRAAWAHTWRVINHTRTGWHYDWSKWVAYTSGAYDRHLGAARRGLNEYRDTLGLDPL